MSGYGHGVEDILDDSLTCVFDDAMRYGADGTDSSKSPCLVYSLKSLQYLRIYSQRHLNMLLEKLITWRTNQLDTHRQEQNSLNDAKNMDISTHQRRGTLLEIAFTQAVMVVTTSPQLSNRMDAMSDAVVSFLETACLKFFAQTSHEYSIMHSSMETIMTLEQDSTSTNPSGPVLFTDRIRAVFSAQADAGFDCKHCGGYQHKADTDDSDDLLFSQWTKVLGRISVARPKSVSSKLTDMVMQHLADHDARNFIARQSKLGAPAMEEMGKMLEGYRHFTLDMSTEAGMNVAVHTVKTLESLLNHSGADTFLRCRTAVALTGMLYRFNHFSYPRDKSFLSWFHVLLSLFDSVLAWGKRKSKGPSSAVVRNAVCPLLGCILSAFCPEHFHLKFPHAFEFLKLCYQNAFTRSMAMYCMNHVLGVYLTKISGGRVDTPMDKVDEVIRTFLFEAARPYADADRQEGLAIENGWISLVLTVCQWNPQFGIMELVKNRLLAPLLNKQYTSLPIGTFDYTGKRKKGGAASQDARSQMRKIIVGLRVIIALLQLDTLHDIRTDTGDVRLYEEEGAFEQSATNHRAVQLLKCRALLKEPNTASVLEESDSFAHIIAALLLKHQWVMGERLSFPWVNRVEAPLLSQTSSYHTGVPFGNEEAVAQWAIPARGAHYADDITVRLFSLALQCIPDVWPSHVPVSTFVPLLLQASVHDFAYIRNSATAAMLRLMGTPFDEKSSLKLTSCDMCVRITLVNELSRMVINTPAPLGAAVHTKATASASSSSSSGDAKGNNAGATVNGAEDDMMNLAVMQRVGLLREMLLAWVRCCKSTQSQSDSVYYYATKPRDIHAHDDDDQSARKGSLFSRFKSFFSNDGKQKSEQPEVAMEPDSLSHVCNRIDIHLLEASALLNMGSLSPAVRCCGINVLEHSCKLAELHAPAHTGDGLTFNMVSENKNSRNDAKSDAPSRGSLAAMRQFVASDYTHLLRILEQSPVPVATRGNDYLKITTPADSIAAWKHIALSSSNNLSSSDLFHVDDDSHSNTCFSRFWVWTWGHLLRSLVLLAPRTAALRVDTDLKEADEDGDVKMTNSEETEDMVKKDEATSSSTRTHVWRVLEWVRVPIWRFLGNLYLMRDDDQGLVVSGDDIGKSGSGKNIKLFLFTNASHNNGQPQMFRDQIRLFLHYALFTVIIDPLFGRHTHVLPSFAKLLDQQYMPLRSIGAFALGNVHWAFAKEVFAVLEPIETKLHHAATSTGFRGSNKKLMDSVRTHVAFIYRLQALYLPGNVLRDPGYVRDRFVTHMQHTHHFLSGDHEYRWDTTDLRIVFCIVTRRICEACVGEVPDELSYSFDTAFRKTLFEFLISWSGHGSSSRSFIDRAILHKSEIINKLRNHHSEASVTTLIGHLENSFDRKLMTLQREAVHCMSTLLVGPLFDQDVDAFWHAVNRHQVRATNSGSVSADGLSFEASHSFVFPWLAAVVSDANQNVRSLGYAGLECLVRSNPSLLPSLMDQYFKIDTPVAVGLLLVLGSVLSTRPIMDEKAQAESPIELDQVLNCLVFALGDSSYAVRSMAVSLLPAINSRLNSVPFNIYISSHIPHIYYKVQRGRSELLSQQFATGDTFINQFIFEALRVFELCYDKQQQQNILSYVTPWLARVQLIEDDEASLTLCDALLSVTGSHSFLTAEIEELWQTLGHSPGHAQWIMHFLLSRCETLLKSDNPADISMTLETIRTVSLLQSQVHPARAVRVLVGMISTSREYSPVAPLTLLADVAYVLDWSNVFSNDDAHVNNEDDALSLSTLSQLFHAGLSGLADANEQVAHYSRVVVINCVHAVAFTCRKVYPRQQESSEHKRKISSAIPARGVAQLLQQPEPEAKLTGMNVAHAMGSMGSTLLHTLAAHRRLYMAGQEQAADLIRYVNELATSIDAPSVVGALVDHIMTLISRVAESEFANRRRASSTPTQLLSSWLECALARAVEDKSHIAFAVQSHLLFRILLRKSCDAFFALEFATSQYSHYANSIFAALEQQLRLLALSTAENHARVHILWEHFRSVGLLFDHAFNAFSQDEKGADSGCLVSVDVIVSAFWLCCTALECTQVLNTKPHGTKFFLSVFSVFKQCFELLQSIVDARKHASKLKYSIVDVNIGVLDLLCSSNITYKELESRAERKVVFKGAQRVVMEVLYLCNNDDVALASYDALSYLAEYWSPPTKTTRHNTTTVEMFGVLDIEISSSPVLGVINSCAAQLPWLAYSLQEDASTEHRAQAMVALERLARLCGQYRLSKVQDALALPSQREGLDSLVFLDNVTRTLCGVIPSNHALILAMISCGLASSGLDNDNNDDTAVDELDLSKHVRSKALNVLHVLLECVNWATSGLNFQTTKMVLSRVNALMTDLHLFEQASALLELALTALDYQGHHRRSRALHDFKEDDEDLSSDAKVPIEVENIVPVVPAKPWKKRDDESMPATGRQRAPRKKPPIALLNEHKSNASTGNTGSTSGSARYQDVLKRSEQQRKETAKRRDEIRKASQVKSHKKRRGNPMP